MVVVGVCVYRGGGWMRGYTHDFSDVFASGLNALDWQACIEIIARGSNAGGNRPAANATQIAIDSADPIQTSPTQQTQVQSPFQRPPKQSPTPHLSPKLPPPQKPQYSPPPGPPNPPPRSAAYAPPIPSLSPALSYSPASSPSAPRPSPPCPGTPQR